MAEGGSTRYTHGGPHPPGATSSGLMIMLACGHLLSSTERQKGSYIHWNANTVYHKKTEQTFPHTRKSQQQSFATLPVSPSLFISLVVFLPLRPLSPRIVTRCISLHIFFPTALYISFFLSLHLFLNATPVDKHTQAVSLTRPPKSFEHYLFLLAPSAVYGRALTTLLFSHCDTEHLFTSLSFYSYRP